MAIYLKAVKTLETLGVVVYNYGRNSDCLRGQFAIKKDLTDWKLISDIDIPVSGMVAKICKVYIESSVFPNEMSFQA